MKNRPPRFLFGPPRLLEIRKFEHPPAYLGPPRLFGTWEYGLEYIMRYNFWVIFSLISRGVAEWN